MSGAHPHTRKAGNLMSRTAGNAIPPVSTGGISSGGDDRLSLCMNRLEMEL